jgi:hypothetical protein
MKLTGRIVKGNKRRRQKLAINVVNSIVFMIVDKFMIELFMIEL